MTGLSRRTFLAGSLALAGGALVAPGLGEHLARYAARSALGQPLPPAGPGEGGYGPLTPSVDCPDLALPPGFRCRKFGETGVLMSDGVPTPADHDAMAAFALPNGNLRLVRNHERFGPRSGRAFGPASAAYDPNGPGGATSLEITPAGDRELVRHFVSLNGTIANCAGGTTPWGTWLSCEETTLGIQDGWTRNHGYVFEVSIHASEAVSTPPLTGLGRFQHEAAVVDPTTGIVYLTEDQANAGFYRFLPSVPGQLAAGGRLQMLAVRGQANYETRWGQHVGQALPVDWVEIADPDPADSSGRNESLVYAQGFAAGGARFRRLEGAWAGNGVIYFTSTTGGDSALGQVWEYRPGDPGDPESGALRMVYESSSAAHLDMPDNLCLTPRSGLLICEDGGDQDQYLRGLTPYGLIFDFAKNVVSNSEFAGGTFSPDGETLFVNLQRPGATYAIWGPWSAGAL